MVSEYLTAFANHELYAVHPSQCHGYLGVQGRHVRNGNDHALIGFKRIRFLTGPGIGVEALIEDRYLTEVTA